MIWNLKKTSDSNDEINKVIGSVFCKKNIFERIHFGIIITEYLTLYICEGNIEPMVKFLLS